VIGADGSLVLVGGGVQSGRLGVCGTGSAAYVIEAHGTVAAFRGRFQFVDQGAGSSQPLRFHSVESFAASGLTGEGTYDGFYSCS